MAEPFLGQIMMFGGNFPPRGWRFCDGSLLSIAQNTALFSLLGTTYGGDGRTTFGLPDLRGRVPVGMGSGPGLPAIQQGELAGEPSHTLIISEIPSHNHTLNGVNGDANAGRFANGALANSESNIYNASQPNVSAQPGSIGLTGGSQPHNNMQPYIGINFIIALEGIFPSRG